MKGQHWKNGQLVLTNDLAWGDVAAQEAIKERQLDVFSAGILHDTALIPSEIPFYVIPGSTTNKITVKSGTAIGPTGERIIVDSLVAYDAGNVSLTPPQSSGCVDIPLTNIAGNKAYRVWIRHLDVADPNVFSIAEDNTTKIYTKGLDGYEIVITEDSVTIANPDSTKYLLIAKIVTNALQQVVQSGIAFDERVYAMTKANRIGVYIPATPARPSTYAAGEIKYLDDHVNSVGSGTVSNVNPHGITPEDLGITVIEGENHQSKLHSNGIFTANQNSITSALYPYVYAPTEETTDYILIKSLSNDVTLREQAVVNGKAYTPALMDGDVAITFEAIPANDGKYYLVYLDSADMTIKKSVPFDDDYGTAFMTLVRDYRILPICSVQWKKNPSPGSPDNYDLMVDTLKDWRVFGNTGNLNVNPHIVAGLSMGGAIGNRVNTFYRGQITNTKTQSSYDVTGLTLTARIDGDVTNRTATFTGTNPIPVLEIISQIQASDIGTNGAVIYLTPERHIRVLGVSSIEIVSGSALTELGFTASVSDTTLKEIITENEYAGRALIEYDAYDRISVVTSRYGNKTLKQTIEYLTASTDADIRTITEELI